MVYRGVFAVAVEAGHFWREVAELDDSDVVENLVQQGDEQSFVSSFSENSFEDDIVGDVHKNVRHMNNFSASSEKLSV